MPRPQATTGGTLFDAGLIAEAPPANISPLLYKGTVSKFGELSCGGEASFCQDLLRKAPGQLATWL